MYQQRNSLPEQYRVPLILEFLTFYLRMAFTFLTGIVSYLVAWAILGHDDQDQLTSESAMDFTVRMKTQLMNTKESQM